jgi:hypothetical protein
MTTTAKQIKVPKVGTLFDGRMVVLSRRRRRDGAAVFLTVKDTDWPYQVWVWLPTNVVRHDATYHYFDEAYKTYLRV